MAQEIFEQYFDFLELPTVPLQEVVDVRDGTHDSPKSNKVGYPLVTSKHLLSFGVDSSTSNRISKDDFDKINERSLVQHLDILISMIGTIGIVSLVGDEKVEFAIKNVGLFKTSQNTDLAYYLYLYLNTDRIKTHIDSRLAGSTQKYISLGELRKIPFPTPDEKPLRQFNDVVAPIFKEIIGRVQESRNLIELRDSLLPKLMTGEISVID